MGELNKKLLNAYYDNDLKKMEKYLIKGADSSYNNDAIFTMAVCFGRVDVLNLLIKYNVQRIKENHQIIGLACAYNQIDCIKLLVNYVDLDDFKYYDTYETIKKIKNEQTSHLTYSDPVSELLP